jgi:hypothetical protein
MRLTLRTLLAWLDDTLQPTQVKEIGKQVADSPFAQDLSQRIHRVTRQRRLTVPASSGPDATDPNIVAGYLDNDLDPEAVAEYEKKCLTSDVNLAEVASVHQILSLLGQKVKVPDEARARMYQLVRGREALRPKRSEVRPPQVIEPVTKPIAPWVVPEPPKNVWLERFGPIGACLILIALALWSATRSLTRQPAVTLPPSSGGLGTAAEGVIAPTENLEPAPEGPQQLDAAPASEALTGASPISVPGSAGESNPSAAATGPTGTAPATPSNPADAGRVVASKDSTAASRPKEPAPLPAVPAGAPGIAEEPDGILLRYDPDKRDWIRLLKATPLAQFDRLLCLAPFRATIALSKTRIILVGETEVRILSQATDKMPALELVQGRLLVRQPDSTSFKIGPSERAVTLEASQESGLGLERVDRREYGQSVSRIAPLAVYCSQGDLTISADKKHDTLTASSVVTVDASGQLKSTKLDSLPSWVLDVEPSSLELQLREQFLRSFHPGRPVLTEIVAASEDDRPDIKKLSITALKALDDLSLLMPILSRENDPVSRHSALAAIRAYMGLGSEAAAKLREQLVQEYGDDLAAFVEKMLIGFSGDEPSNPMLFIRLVDLLPSDQKSVGVRELALDSLKRLTGRDDLGYNPDHPEGKGLNAWKDLARRGELRPLARPARVK